MQLIEQTYFGSTILNANLPTTFQMNSKIWLQTCYKLWQINVLEWLISLVIPGWKVLLQLPNKWEQSLQIVIIKLRQIKLLKPNKKLQLELITTKPVKVFDEVCNKILKSIWVVQTRRKNRRRKCLKLNFKTLKKLWKRTHVSTALMSLIIF